MSEDRLSKKLTKQVMDEMLDILSEEQRRDSGMVYQNPAWKLRDKILEWLEDGEDHGRYVWTVEDVRGTRRFGWV